jgi:uncharacterized glyoxalase superfamily protein PhnB
VDLPETPAVSVALAVEDVEEASRFYHDLGFREQFSLPDGSGGLALSILTREGSMLLLGPIEEVHYAGPERTKLIQAGPRGLGITLILQVDDLDETYDLVRRSGLKVLVDPVEEYYGDRVFFFLDPYGYEWKVSQPVEDVTEEEVTQRATRGGDA